MSGPSLVGFLAPGTHNECPKKAARGKKDMPTNLIFTMKVTSPTRTSVHAQPLREVCHV